MQNLLQAKVWRRICVISHQAENSSPLLNKITGNDFCACIVLLFSKMKGAINKKLRNNSYGVFSQFDKSSLRRVLTTKSSRSLVGVSLLTGFNGLKNNKTKIH